MKKSKVRIRFGSWRKRILNDIVVHLSKVGGVDGPKRISINFNTKGLKIKVVWGHNPHSVPDESEIRLRLRFEYNLRYGFSAIWSLYRIDSYELHMDVRHDSVGWREQNWGAVSIPEGVLASCDTWDLSGVENLSKPDSWFENEMKTDSTLWKKPVTTVANVIAGIQDVPKRVEIWVPPEPEQ